MTLTAAREKVVRNPCASTVAVVTPMMALLLWVAATVGATMPLWVAALLVGWLLSAFLGFPGLRGIWRFLLDGRGNS